MAQVSDMQAIIVILLVYMKQTFFISPWKVERLFPVMTNVFKLAALISWDGISINRYID